VEELCVWRVSGHDALASLKVRWFVCLLALFCSDTRLTQFTEEIDNNEKNYLPVFTSFAATVNGVLREKSSADR
jgi:hypothetical protein